MQVEPIKTKLKAPGTMCLKINNGKLLSSFAFKSHLRRSTSGAVVTVSNTVEPVLAQAEIDVLLAEVGRCRLTVSNAVLTVPMVFAINA